MRRRAFERRPQLGRSQQCILLDDAPVSPVHELLQPFAVDVRAAMGRPDERERRDRAIVQSLDRPEGVERAGAAEEHIPDQRVAQRLGLYAEPVRAGRALSLRPFVDLAPRERAVRLVDRSAVGQAADQVAGSRQVHAEDPADLPGRRSPVAGERKRSERLEALFAQGPPVPPGEIGEQRLAAHDLADAAGNAGARQGGRQPREAARLVGDQALQIRRPRDAGRLGDLDDAVALQRADVDALRVRQVRRHLVRASGPRDGRDPEIGSRYLTDVQNLGEAIRGQVRVVERHPPRPQLPDGVGELAGIPPGVEETAPVGGEPLEQEGLAGARSAHQHEIAFRGLQPFEVCAPPDLQDRERRARADGVAAQRRHRSRDAEQLLAPRRGAVEQPHELVAIVDRVQPHAPLGPDVPHQALPALAADVPVRGEHERTAAASRIQIPPDALPEVAAVSLRGRRDEDVLRRAVGSGHAVLPRVAPGRHGPQVRVLVLQQIDRAALERVSVQRLPDGAFDGPVERIGQLLSSCRPRSAAFVLHA